MRRRPFRRVPRVPRNGRPIPGRPPIPPKLREANNYFRIGKYRKAAVLYDEMYEKGMARGIARAPQLLIQAGFAWIKASEEEKGIQRLKDHFLVLKEREDWTRMRRISRMCVNRLKDEGYPALSDDLQYWLENEIPQDKLKEVEQHGRDVHVLNRQAVDLPSTCPQCGAPVHPAEVEWYNARIAQCPFCDAILDKDS